MPDSYGRMTSDEASPILKEFIFGDGSKTCRNCDKERSCPYVGQVCAMFKKQNQGANNEIVWDTENDQEAINYNGSKPVIEGDMIYVTELGCSCAPPGCGGCIEIEREYKIGESQYVWKEIPGIIVAPMTVSNMAVQNMKNG